MSGAIAIGSPRTLLRLANLHWNVRERNLNRSWPGVLLVVLLLVADRTTLDKWVGDGAVRVKVTSADGRDTVKAQASISSGGPMTPGVGRQDGPVLLETLGLLVLDAVGRLFG